jgi:methyl-accepting chemotaxis protein
MGWTDVVVAISTALIALTIVSSGVLAVAALRELRGLRAALERALGSLETDARPVLESARELVADASRIVEVVRTEADGFAETSSDLRERLGKLVVRTEERLQDLDALVDVVQYEVEETALDVAAALRTTRRSASIFRAMKRAFLRRGR